MGMTMSEAHARADLRHVRRQGLGVDQSRDARGRRLAARAANHPLAHSGRDARRAVRLRIRDVGDRSRALMPGPLFHLTSGASLLGAFFIATDPVSAATSDRGRLIYGAGIGVLTYVIRTWGGYPDGVAFAVLLMNLSVPLIDRYTIPRIYGHAR